MNKIRKFLTAKWCAMLSSLLAVLGFAACGNGKNDVDEPCLYGQPYAKFKIEGAVLNEDGKGVEGVQVYVRDYYGDTTKTDQQGKYVFNAERFYLFDNNIWVIAEDTKGNYKPDSVSVTPKYEGGDGWFSGSYATTHNFTLKKKTEEHAPEGDKGN